MDRLDAMNLFVRVAERGSFAAVAQQLGVARSVVTRQIAALEAHLGIKLLARSTRRSAKRIHTLRCGATSTSEPQAVAAICPGAPRRRVASQASVPWLVR